MITKETGWQQNGAVSERIREHIEILQGTSLSFAMIFRNPVDTDRIVQDMTILQEAGYITRKDMLSSEKWSANHWIRFNSRIVENMLEGLNKPINSAVLFGIRSDFASTLYILLDLYLARSTKWERRSKELFFVELGVEPEGSRYQKRFIRKQKLQDIVRQLDGKALVRGTLSISIGETVDGTDWKIIARKIMPKITARQGLKTICSAEEAEAIAEEFADFLTALPKSGVPKISYMVFLARYIPKANWFEALSIVKSDYRESIRKFAVNAFIFELKRIANSKRIPYPQKSK